MRTRLGEEGGCSREDGSKLLKARETEFRGLKLQRLGKERNFVDVLNLKVRRA